MKSTLSLVIAAALATSAAQAADNWQFEIEPYLAATSIKGDAGIGRIAGVDVDVDFSTILENLKMAAMIHAEALHQSGWGVILDYGFMDLEKDGSGPRGGIIDAGLRQGVLEALLFYRLEQESSDIDIYAGLRWWDNDIELEIDPVALPGSRKTEVEEDWVDPVVGGRITRPLSDKWSLTARADIGGFGIASDLTYSLSAGAKYRVNESITIDAQYKGTWVDYEDGTPGTQGYFKYDTVTHGPLLGVIFTF